MISAILHDAPEVVISVPIAVADGVQEHQREPLTERRPDRLLSAGADSFIEDEQCPEDELIPGAVHTSEPSDLICHSESRLTYTRGNTVLEGWRLSFKARLADPWKQEVELTTDERFTDLQGSVVFQDANRKSSYVGNDIGSLSYWKGNVDIISGDPPSFIAEVRLPPVELAKVFGSVEAGLPLTAVSVDAPSLKYGWAPDGSVKRWDNAATPILEIEGYRLTFGKAESDDGEDDRPADLSTSAAEVTILGELQRIAQSSRYASYAAAAIAVMLLWWRL